MQQDNTPRRLGLGRNWLGEEAHWSAEKSQRFFWGRFHEEGLGIARRLQALVIDEAVVRYWRPAQDPRHQQDREIRL